jgi:hypothetical protein
MVAVTNGRTPCGPVIRRVMASTFSAIAEK